MLRTIGDSKLRGVESSEEKKERIRREKLKRDYKESLKKDEARLLVGDPILHESSLHIEAEVGTDIGETIEILKLEYPEMPISLLLYVGQLRFYKAESGEIQKAGTNIPSQVDSDRLYDDIMKSPYKVRNFIQRCHSHLFKGKSKLYKRTGFQDDAMEAFDHALQNAGIDPSTLNPDTESINEEFIRDFVIPAFREKGVLVEYQPHVTEDPTSLVQEFSQKVS